MPGDEDKTAPAGSGVPEWQRGASSSHNDDAEAAATAAPAPANTEPSQDALDVARRFLSDEEVKASPREKKIEFLKAKGIEDGDIQKLLEETGEPPSAEVKQPTAGPATPEAVAQPQTDPAADRAPIITYPEFLTRQAKSSKPPLVTTSGVLATVQATAALSALVVGTSRYVLTPMLERLTDARLELHATTSDRLGHLVARLESTVSEIPAVAAPSRRSHTEDGAADDDSSDGDPTEMFHRDVGTQTAYFSPPASSPAGAAETSATEKQAASLQRLTSSMSKIRDDFRSQSDDLADVKTLVDVFRDELDGLTYPTASEVSGDFGIYGRSSYGSKADEPEDEIRKVRDSIRRVKGALLSARTFPVSSR